MDRLKALSVFKAVADNRSFVAAASVLDVSCATGRPTNKPPVRPRFATA